MMFKSVRQSATLFGLMLLPGGAYAHSFGQVYNLPVPVWLYLYGAGAALALSFLVIGFMASAQPDTSRTCILDLSDKNYVGLARRLLPGARMLSVGLLLLCIATGLWGTPNPYGNFNMTFFWIIFVLGFAYFAALAGNGFALVNPWRVLVASLGRVLPNRLRSPVNYPSCLGYWPALILYMGFIWIELFGMTTPYSLALILLGYSALNLLGAALIGAHAWFTYCELFSVFFRLLGSMAPLTAQCVTPVQNDSRPALQRELLLRVPFTGLIDRQAASVGLLLFILFMLSSTAFDGLHETQIWRRLFWVDLYHAGLQGWVGRNPLAAFPKMNTLYYYWQAIWLLASPFIYLAVYWIFIWLSKLAAASELSVRTLALRFAYTLLPIALVYNITHYYTLIQTQGVKIISLASDPFSWGWDLFGTANWLQRAIIPDAVFVWHVQVGLIVLGHIISVYLAHRVALRTFADSRRALLSQLPMLMLMVLFTCAGLWILAQPISGG